MHQRTQSNWQRPSSSPASPASPKSWGQEGGVSSNNLYAVLHLRNSDARHEAQGSSSSTTIRAIPLRSRPSSGLLSRPGRLHARPHLQPRPTLSLRRRLDPWLWRWRGDLPPAHRLRVRPSRHVLHGDEAGPAGKRPYSSGRALQRSKGRDSVELDVRAAVQDLCVTDASNG